MLRRLGFTALFVTVGGCGGGEFTDGETFVVVSGECSTTQVDSTSNPYEVRFSNYVADIAPDGCIGSFDMEFHTCANGCVPTSCSMCLRRSAGGYELLPIFDPEQVPGSQQCASTDWRGSGSASYRFFGEIVSGRAELNGDVLEIDLTADGEGGLGAFSTLPATMSCSITAVRE